ncbi:hypothetical protein OS493_012650 [Desmophyllum pertusum]|uniref:PKD/REJ-like domain-containing protein n=1 Tax=Desmophyllum pertusum TaxID=174260 RepID=A0A9W9ZDV3_9CNID|nr:hypothetical protein OS493_012650 [Desmophyllum pertusum]
MASHLLMVVQQRTLFFISCIYNCGPEVIPSRQMIIESNCTGDICGKITRHHWSLFKMISEDSSLSWVEIIDLDTRILTDLDNPSLVLTGRNNGNDYSLEMNTTYKISGSIMVAGGPLLDDEIIFRTVAPLSVPLQGCSVQPVEGFVFKTNFSVNCSGWHAENQFLTYKYSYIASTGTVTTNRALPNPYITSLLPKGKKSEDYNVVIRVDIFDQRGASHVEKLTVKVKPLPQNDSSLNVETVNNNIKEFLKKGKVSEAATHAIVALSSYDDDDEAKDSTLQAMADSQISHVSQVTQFCAIVIMATENRIKISMNTVDGATALLIEATNFLRTFDEDRDVVEQAGEHLILGISNTLRVSTDLADDLSQQEGETELN